VLVKSYEVCSTSGELGPKRRQGDHQVPEGFYHIDYYNPWSSYHLSVRINYPNQSDKILSPFKNNLGNNICIHGDCVSIGCIAIQDENIKEVYWLMVQAHGAGQANVPVHIFPSKLDDATFKALREEYKNDKDKIALWENLQTGYQYFEENKKLPTITVDKKGKYIFK
jgi:murein L,D-transpeptidase YafK